MFFMYHLPVEGELLTSQWAVQIVHIIRNGKPMGRGPWAAEPVLRTLEIVASSHVPCDVIDRGIWSWLKGLKFLFGFEFEVFVDVNRPNRVSCQRI